MKTVAGLLLLIPLLLLASAAFADPIDFVPTSVTMTFNRCCYFAYFAASGPQGSATGEVFGSGMVFAGPWSYFANGFDGITAQALIGSAPPGGSGASSSLGWDTLEGSGGTPWVTGELRFNAGPFTPFALNSPESFTAYVPGTIQMGAFGRTDFFNGTPLFGLEYSGPGYAIVNVTHTSQCPDHACDIFITSGDVVIQSGYPVPEPSSLTLLGPALMVTLAFKRKLLR